MILTTRHTWEAVWGSLAGRRLGLAVGEWPHFGATQPTQKSWRFAEQPLGVRGCCLGMRAASHGGETRLLRSPADVEEQGLADDRLDVVRVERLGDEERRLGARAGQQPLWVGRHEDRRHR